MFPAGVRRLPVLDRHASRTSLIPPAGLHATHHVASIRRSPAPAQTVTGSHARGPRFFVSWGYNGDSYTKSDLHIRQQSLGSDFTLVSVQARDSKPWTSIFNHSLFVPQYNVRAGFFFNERWGIELALDHFKWIVKQGQEVRITGTLNGAAVDIARHAHAGRLAVPVEQRRESHLRERDQARTAPG